MRRFLSTLLFLTLLGGVGFLAWQQLRIDPAQTPIEAAFQLEDCARQGGGKVSLRTEQLDPNEIYAALEAVYPYAFSLNLTTYLTGVTEYEVVIDRRARQEEAEAFAAQFAADAVSPDMTQREQVQALHDALVRLCVYDTAAAADEARSGNTAPFAADGALLDHSAVCAGYGRAFVMLCHAIDVDAIYITSSTMDHGWNAVSLDGQTYYIDVTFDDPVPDRGDYVTEDFFLCTAEQLRPTHTWDEAFYDAVMQAVREK